MVDRPAIFDNLFVGYSLREKVTQLKKAGDVTRTKKAQRAANVEQAEKDQRDEYMRWAEMVCSTDIQVGERLCKHVRYWPTNSGKPLYESGLIEGEDYIICPITKLRKAMIRSNYVENILAMTMEEYSAVVGPDFVYTAPNHKNTIAESLKVVDEETGLTKTEISVIKAQEKLNSVDETTGLTGHEMRIAKTVNTHKNKIDENGLNGYQRIGKKAIIKGNKTKQDRGLITLDEEKPSYVKYKNLVHYITNKSRHLLDTSKSGRAGTDGATHVDHKYSIMRGFKNAVSPFVVGNYHNLEVIPWADNVSKNAKCSIELDVLMGMCEYTEERSKAEFEIFEKLLEDVDGDHNRSSGILMERILDETTKLKEQQI